MTLSTGTRLGPYEIVAPIGAGGMGEVYRARDTRLERTVAVKVLPSHLAASADSRQRFEREARTISQLSHPHICALYDVGREGETEYLVMEYLEGETLSDRLAKGSLPIGQVLRYGCEVADGLDKAHRQGIVHRDLKPGNVMITKSGVKLLDFGLARALVPASAAIELTALPTQAAALTQEGTILGTLQYMAPEQLEAKEADARTDIFAFGAVLYEMATGGKAFSGASQASLIGSILRDEPRAISEIQPMTPPAFDRVVRTCLAKDPDDRWQTAHDIAVQLKWIQEGGSAVGLPAPVAARRRSRERLWMSAAAALALSTALLAFFLVRNLPAPARVIQSAILPPEKAQFNFEAGAMALSPDGKRLAFVATTSDGKALLFVRELSGLSSQPLAGTEDAIHPFWSPDSRYLGFFAGGKLKKIEASGGPPETLCDAPVGRGGSWNRDGVIVFAAAGGGPLSRVSSEGGTPASVTELDKPRGEESHRWPFFLPDGRHFLYLARGLRDTSTQSRIAAIRVASLDSKRSEILLRTNANAVYVPPRHLLFWREGTLVAQPFDPKARRLTGDAFPVAGRVSRSQTGGVIFSASESGLLAYHGGGDLGFSQLIWYDRGGRQLETVGVPAEILRPRLSHDGTRVAVEISDRENGTRDIWIHDLSRRAQSRFTFDTTHDNGPIWSPDDSRILFSSARVKAAGLFQKLATGAGSEEALFASDASAIPTDCSADGRWITFTTYGQGRGPGTNADLWILSVADRKAAVFLRTEFSESGGQFSPDGRWMAYVSDESGRPEVYVQHFPGPGGKWQASPAGGHSPRWSRDGRELFYVAPGDNLMSIDVKGGEAFGAGVPKLLFGAPMLLSVLGTQYDVSADGQRFLVNRRAADTAEAPITLVVDWAAGGRK